jgi:hypothetical protein
MSRSFPQHLVVVFVVATLLLSPAAQRDALAQENLHEQPDVVAQEDALALQEAIAQQDALALQAAVAQLAQQAALAQQAGLAQQPVLAQQALRAQQAAILAHYRTPGGSQYGGYHRPSYLFAWRAGRRILIPGDAATDRDLEYANRLPPPPITRPHTRSATVRDAAAWDQRRAMADKLTKAGIPTDWIRYSEPQLEELLKANLLWP